MLEVKHRADIGVIGGSGFYSLLDKPSSVAVDTPYGLPSGQYMLGRVGRKKVAFLARHGLKHQYPPHAINYRANLFGFKQLGVKFIISPCACGSLQPKVKPADMVICDQFVDRTKGRIDTYYHGSKTVHIACDEPYCSRLRKLAIRVGKKLGYSIHGKGTVVVINGPRFSTRSESEWFSRQGWQVINMTQYPEVVLARELEMCFVNISLITDYDVGVKGDNSIKPVTIGEVIKIFNQNNKKVKQMILEMIKGIDVRQKCVCHRALESAVV